MPDSLAPEILSTMGVLVTRRKDFEEFILEGPLPLWYLRMIGPDSKAGDKLEIGEHFSFLETFLPTAMNFWGANKPGRIRSGYWVEMNAGNELPLKACAACVEGEHFLLIEYVKTAYDQGKGHLQKARDHMLETEQATVAAERRESGLLAAVRGTVLLVTEAGDVLESTGPVADDTLARVIEAGKRSLETGSPCDFEGGRVAPAGTQRFWAVVEAGSSA